MSNPNVSVSVCMCMCRFVASFVGLGRVFSWPHVFNRRVYIQIDVIKY